METKKIANPQDIYQIKVTLLGTDPPIWRRLLVPAGLTLAQLHDVVQTAMGWQNSHMHEFRAGQRYFGKPDPDDRSMGMDPVENERTARLSEVLRKTGPKLIYTYDLRILGWVSGIPALPPHPGASIELRSSVSCMWTQILVAGISGLRPQSGP